MIRALGPWGFVGTEGNRMRPEDPGNCGTPASLASHAFQCSLPPMLPFLCKLVASCGSSQ